VFTNASGTLLANSAKDNRYTYTGREWDEELSLYHFRARMYDQKSGRFCGRDPLGFKGSWWNLHEFLRAGLAGVDPFGLVCFKTPPCEPRSPGQCCADSIGTFLEQGVIGRAFCCDGKAVACVYEHKIPAVNPISKEKLKKCFFKHEHVHTRDAVCPDRCPYQTFIQYKKGVNDDKSECWALIRTHSCLKVEFLRCKNRAPECDSQEIYNVLVEIVRRGKEQCKFQGKGNYFSNYSVGEPF
jgi:RHS repeat-associated protein